MTSATETMTSAAPVTQERPVPLNLDKELPNAGVARAVDAVSKEKPQGTKSYDNRGLSVLQQHVDFFDRNHDGIIYPWETYLGFRALGFNIVLSFIGILLINLPFSYPSQPGWLPHPLFAIYVKNIHKTKHGSDTGVYDTEGRFLPNKFEEIFTKYDKDGKGGLTFKELMDMTGALKCAMDPFGWTAAKLEWGVTYWLLADNKGIVSKEKIRATYDGSIFKKIEEERKAAQAAKQRPRHKKQN